MARFEHFGTVIGSQIGTKGGTLVDIFIQTVIKVTENGVFLSRTEVFRLQFLTVVYSLFRCG